MKTIILVEDDVALRETLIEILSEKYKVLYGGNGLEGMKLVNDNKYDLVLSDVRMPKCDGIDFYKK